MSTDSNTFALDEQTMERLSSFLDANEVEMNAQSQAATAIDYHFSLGPTVPSASDAQAS